MALCTLGCAETLLPNPADSERAHAGGSGSTSPSNSGFEVPSESGNFSHAQSSRGTISMVDATHYDELKFLDLDSGESTESGWDVAFRRFLILTNGGVSGDAGVQALKLTDTAFVDVEVVPEGDHEWVVDQPDGAADEDSFADTIFNDGRDDWYNYDLVDHSLSTKGHVYIVRSSERRYYKLRVESYYDSVGTPGVVTFVWREIDRPQSEIPDQDLPDDSELTPTETPDDSTDPDDEDPTDPDEPGDPDDRGDPDGSEGLLTVDASSYDDFVYLSVGQGVIQVDDPETSTAWDLAVRRYVFLTNGGTSGPGMGGARVDQSGLDFDQLLSIEPDGFIVDEILPATDAPGSTETTGSPVLETWYDYQGLGALSPKEQTFLIRTADGNYAKMRIHSYSGGIFEIALLPVTYQP